MNRLYATDVASFTRKYRFTGGRMRRVKLKYATTENFTVEFVLTASIAAKDLGSQPKPVKLRFRITGVEEFRFQKRPTMRSGSVTEARIGWFQDRFFVNLDAWANAGAAGTVTSAAFSQGLLTLTDGKLSGSYTASFSIDVTATVAADHATIHLRITDSFQLSLAGTGYVGASLLQTTAAGGTVVSMTQSGAPPAANHNQHFDLARFAASVLNTGQWNIAFVASAAGESLHAVGASVLTIAATADLAGGPEPERLSFYDTERSRIAFNDTSSPAMGMPYGMQVSRPESVSLFHDA